MKKFQKIQMIFWQVFKYKGVNMRINIGEIEVNYDLTEDEKNILTNEEQEYYKFIKETEMAEKCLKLELQKQLETFRKPEPQLDREQHNGYYTATQLGYMFDVGCSKIGTLASKIGLKNTNKVNKVVNKIDYKGIQIKYYYNYEAVIELGKLLNYFRDEIPNESQIEEVMSLLKKIEFCYEPNKKEIELLNAFNYKYLQKIK